MEDLEKYLEVEISKKELEKEELNQKFSQLEEGGKDAEVELV